MIQSLEITNFRGIKKGELSFSPITILLGPNNSAKSTILEALFLAPNPFREVTYMDPRTSRKSALDVLYSMHRTLDYQGFAFLLHNYLSTDCKISCDVDGKKFCLQFLVVGDTIHLVSDQVPPNYQQEITIDKEIVKSFGYVYLQSSDIRPSYYSPFFEETLLVSPKLITFGYEYFKRNWTKITNLRISRKVAKETSKFTFDHYDDFVMEPVYGGHLDIHAYLNDGRRIRLGDLGEGVQSFAMSRMLYELINPQTILWDDIESHLNPRILGYIAEWFNELVKNGKQIVLSTHSLEAANVIAGVNEEETRIYLTSLQESTLKTKKLTLSELEDFQRAGIDVRTAEAFLL